MSSVDPKYSEYRALYRSNKDEGCNYFSYQSNPERQSHIILFLSYTKFSWTSIEKGKYNPNFYYKPGSDYVYPQAL